MHLIETVPISDTYCSGMAKIEKLPCGNLRLWAYTNQAADCGAGPVETVLVAKLVFPAAAIVPLVLMAMGVIGADLDAAGAAALNEAMDLRGLVHH
jgi:hypothetical protein